jgi:hypothetical protein
MRAEILGLAAGSFEVQPELRPDGRIIPPAFATLSLRPCWRKPAVKYRVAYLFTDEENQVAYYDVVEEI